MNDKEKIESVTKIEMSFMFNDLEYIIFWEKKNFFQPGNKNDFKYLSALHGIIMWESKQTHLIKFTQFLQ